MRTRIYKDRLLATYKRSCTANGACASTLELDSIFQLPHPQREIAFVEWARRTAPAGKVSSSSLKQKGEPSQISTHL